MIGWNVRATCEEARLHYYRCLEDPAMVDVPQEIRDHVKDCAHCREEIRRLDHILNRDDAAEKKADRHASMINSLLGLHFQYVDSVVTCSSAKLFFASLADPEIELRVPTPITVHIDQCPQCAEDLRTLKKLGLSNAQLRRLHQIYSDLLTKDMEECPTDDDAIKAVAELSYANIDDTTLKHVCVCSHCRRRVTEARRKNSRRLRPRNDEKLCRTVHWANLFDYMFPYSFNPLADSCHKFRQILVDHLRHCPVCLKKMLDMAHHIYAIGDRADCGVTTCFHLEADVAQDRPSQKRYEGYPIYVDVRRLSMKERVSNSSTEFEEAVSKRADPHYIKRLSLVKVAAVIVFVVGLSMFSWLPRAGAGFLDKIYQATLNAPVVHIKIIEPQSEVVLQECWVLPKENRLIINNKDVTKAVDLNAKIFTILDRSSAQLETRLLEEDRRRQMEQEVRTLFGLMPYGFQSQSVDSSDGASDIYEMEWTDETGATTKRWRAHVDPSSHRLRKATWYIEDLVTGSLSEARRYDLDYPEPRRVQQLLEQVKFQPSEP